MSDEKIRRFSVVDGGAEAEARDDCWRRPAGTSAVFTFKTAGVTDFAQAAVNAACTLFPEGLEETEGELRVAVRYAPSCDPAWRHWVDEVERVHRHHPTLSLAAEVADFIAELRGELHWATKLGAESPSIATHDDDIQTLRSMVLAEADRRSWGMWLLLAAGSAQTHRNALTRRLVRRALADGETAIWRQPVHRSPHPGLIRQEATVLLGEAVLPPAAMARIRAAVELVELWQWRR